MYSVNYGVNNSHMTEFENFPLYRDAVKFYNALEPIKWKAASVCKLVYGTKPNELGLFVVGRTPKLYRFEEGMDNTGKILGLYKL